VTVVYAMEFIALAKGTGILFGFEGGNGESSRHSAGGTTNKTCTAGVVKRLGGPSWLSFLSARCFPAGKFAHGSLTGWRADTRKYAEALDITVCLPAMPFVKERMLVGGA
jgi:hypothetical protein